MQVLQKFNSVQKLKAIILCANFFSMDLISWTYGFGRVNYQQEKIQGHLSKEK